MAAGGVGGLGIIGVLLYLFLGGNPGDLVSQYSNPQSVNQQGEDGGDPFAHCQTGADANEHTDCRMILTAESLDVMWSDILLANENVRYEMPGLTLFSNGVSSACGNATSATGPFYCSADDSVYLDVSFFTALEDRLGATNSPLAQMYIVAHEFGHHIQNQLGILTQVNHRETGADSDYVRMELQADCYAGMWVHHASSTIDPDTGEAFLEQPTTEELRSAQDAAAAVGDDRIQENAGMQINQDTWTHGSAEQRLHWFNVGLEHGDMNKCNTFDIREP